MDTAPARVGAFCERSPRIRPNSVVAPPLVCPSGRLRRGDIPRGRARRFGLAFAFQNASPIPLGLLRPLRGSGFALGQPDAFGAGESRSGYSRLTARIVPRVRGTFRDTTSDDDRTRGGAWRFWDGRGAVGVVGAANQDTSRSILIDKPKLRGKTPNQGPRHFASPSDTAALGWDCGVFGLTREGFGTAQSPTPTQPLYHNPPRFVHITTCHDALSRDSTCLSASDSPRGIQSESR